MGGDDKGPSVGLILIVLVLLLLLTTSACVVIDVFNATQLLNVLIP